jgi:tRNA modification GTPase
MNALAGFDLSIVTPIPGTTRDVMKTHVVLDGLPVQLIDTAGLRQTDDVVEQEGISRAWEALGQADCVLMLVDINEPKTDELSAEIKQKIAQSVAYIQVLNKIDTLDGLKWLDETSLRISAKTGEGLTELKDRIKKTLGYQEQENEGLFLARARHVDALNQALSALERGREQLLIHHAAELLAADLGYAHQALSQITGEFTPDDLLGKIFSSFCIGK